MTKFNSLQEAIHAVTDAYNADRTVDPDAPVFEDHTVLEINGHNNAIIVVGGIAYQRDVAPFGSVLPKLSEIPNISKRRHAADHLASFYRTKVREALDDRYREKRDAVYREIAAMLGGKAVYREGRLLVNGHPVYGLNIDQGRTERGYRGEPNGTVVVTINTGDGRRGYRERPHRFPEKKNGGHNFVEIVSLVRMLVDREERARKLEVNRRANADAITDELRAELKPIDPYNITPSQMEGKPIFIKYAIANAVTAETAKAVAAKLREIQELLKGE